MTGFTMRIIVAATAASIALCTSTISWAGEADTDVSEMIKCVVVSGGYTSQKPNADDFLAVLNKIYAKDQSARTFAQQNFQRIGEETKNNVMNRGSKWLSSSWEGCKKSYPALSAKYSK